MIGVILSEETKNKMSISHKLRGMSKENKERVILANKARSLKLKIFGKIYDSLGEASNDLKITGPTIIKKVRSNSPEHKDYQLL